MIEILSLSIVSIAGFYFIVLAGVSLFNSPQANRFLLGFAGSLFKHLAELLIRFLVGSAFVIYAPHMYLSEAFIWFGWILIVTTSALLFVPWKLHRRFANYAVPIALQYLTLVGIVSLALGGLVIYAVIRGSAV